MKKRFKPVMAVLGAIFGVALLGAVSAQATNNSEGYVKVDDGTVTSADQNVNHSMILAGLNVDSKDTVDGILFGLGNNVETHGTSTYNVLAGTTVKIDGTTDKDLFAAGSVVNLNQGAKVGRDAYLAGGTVNVNSNVSGNAFITAGSLKLSNVTINGDLNVYANEITFDKSVTVNGSVEFNDNAKVNGRDNLKATGGITTFAAGENGGWWGGVSWGYGDYAIFILLAGIGLLAVTMVMCLVFPGVYRKLSELFKKWKTGTAVKNVVFGICAIIVVPIVSVILMLTVVGLPLAIISLMFYLTCLYMSTAFAGILFGHLILTKLLKSKANVYLEAVIGIALICLVALIPFIGWVVALCASLVGLGLIMDLIIRRKRK